MLMFFFVTFFWSNFIYFVNFLNFFKFLNFLNFFNFLFNFLKIIFCTEEFRNLFVIQFPTEGKMTIMNNSQQSISIFAFLLLFFHHNVFIFIVFNPFKVMFDISFATTGDLIALRVLMFFDYRSTMF